MRATRRVCVVSTVSMSATSAVAGSKSSQRTVAPTDSAAITQGRMFESWSSRLTTTSSPGPHSCDAARVRAMSMVSWVIERPKTTPPGSTPSRSPTAARAPRVTASVRRSVSVSVPRWHRPPVIVSATARATEEGTCEPPGPSKWAIPWARAGNCARTRSTSYVVVVIRRTRSRR